MTGTDAPGSFTTEDLVYHSPDGTELLARLYRPTGPGPHPAVVDVHGGRWCAETRLTNAAIDEALAASGIVSMAIDFRMPPEARYPLPVADINAAIRWLKVRASTYAIRADWIGGLGTSSGGHQLLLNALNPGDPRFAAQHPADLAATPAALGFVVVCWPVSDPPARYRYAIERQLDLHIRSHEAYWADEAAMADGSPQRIVSAGLATHLPPTLIIQGSEDVILTPDMSDRFAAAYRAAGGAVTLNKYPSEGHTFITKAPTSAASRQALDDICAFIHAQTNGRRQ